MYYYVLQIYKVNIKKNQDILLWNSRFWFETDTQIFATLVVQQNYVPTHCFYILFLLKLNVVSTQSTYRDNISQKADRFFPREEKSSYRKFFYFNVLLLCNKYLIRTYCFILFLFNLNFASKKNTSKSKICQQLIDKFVPKCVTILISLYHTWYSVLCLSVIDLKYNKTKSINDLFSKRALKRWKEAINKTRTYPNHMYYFQNVSSVRIFSVVCKINDDKHLYKVIDIKFVE